MTGAVLANVMFAEPAISISTDERASSGHLLAEVTATTGLVLVIFALARSGRSATAPAAVGAYIGAAYWFTSSTSFANPAITIGRTLSDTFAGIAPSSAPAFIAAQLAGGALGLVLIRFLYPDPTAVDATQARGLSEPGADPVALPRTPKEGRDHAPARRRWQ
jgi:arsenate reductase